MADKEAPPLRPPPLLPSRSPSSWSGRDARVQLADLPSLADSESMEVIVDQINASAEREDGGESLD